MICLTGLTFTGQAGIIGHTILMGGAVMADIFIRALPKYAPDLIVLLGLYLLLLGRWKSKGDGGCWCTRCSACICWACCG